MAACPERLTRAKESEGMKKQTLMALFLLAWTVGWTGRVIAQEETAKQLLERGADLARQERFDEAIEIWLGILDKLDGSDLATAEKKLGMAFQQTGRLPEAYHYLSQYLQTPAGQEDEVVASWLLDVETELKKGYVMVTVVCDPPGTTLIIPDSQSGSGFTTSVCNPQSSTTWWFLPGKYQVEARAEGYLPQVVGILASRSVEPGVERIRLAAKVPERVSADVIPGPDQPDATGIVMPVAPEKFSRAIEWTLVGSGLAMGVTGAVLHGVAYSRNEQLHDKYADATKHPYGPDAKEAYDAAFDDEVRPKQFAGYTLYGVGGAALVVGIVTWAVRKPGSESDDTAPLTVAPLTLPGGGGAMMTLEW